MKTERIELMYRVFEEFAREIGAEVKVIPEVEWPKQYADKDGLLFERNEQPVILVLQCNHMGRIIAHEISHAFLHGGKNTVDDAEADRQAEAAAILLETFAKYAIINGMRIPKT